MLRRYLDSVSAVVTITTMAPLIFRQKTQPQHTLTSIPPHFHTRPCTCTHVQLLNAYKRYSRLALRDCSAQRKATHHPTPFPNTITLVLHGCRAITSLLPPSPSSSGTISKPKGSGKYTPSWSLRPSLCGSHPSLNVR
jgi:hypothetical protein